MAAIFIDGDNCSNIDHIEKVLLRLNNSKIIFKYACANNYNDLFKNFLNKYGFRVEENTMKRKNRTDVKIMLEIFELINNNSKIKKIFIISSDTDFDLLCQKLLLKDIDIKLIGYEKSTSERIKNMGIFYPIKSFLPKKKIYQRIETKVKMDSKDRKLLDYLNNYIFSEEDNILISKLKRKLIELDKEFTYKFCNEEWNYFDRYLATKFPNTFKIKKKKKSIHVIKL